ncbi:TetR/AcrR family transcriptional regulator [Streptomyces sp. NPDC058231]|uniref:TetR/AcrR family transcriptional regulator n=1 Tax=Streptomyces sp. NPDC058231 TaxID=3346392 RepID=UPI0036EF3C72
MSQAKVSRTVARAAATHRAIVDAAEHFLLEGGAEALTLEAVAERADVAVQTIYNRVGGRSALLIAVAERALEEVRHYVDVAYASTGTPVERILKAAQAYSRFAAERPHQFRLLADPPNEPTALGRISDILDEENGKLAAAIREGMADGSINPSLNPQVVATTLWAAMNGILALHWRRDRGRADEPQLEELVNTMIEMLTDGLFRQSH